jgi:iron complex transport system substrate-binding protein
VKIYHALFFFIVFLGIFCINGCRKTDEKKDILENRIISLAPHTTEIIYALEAQNQLLAVTDYCRYPEDASTKAKIGGLLNPNIEKMVSLHPTHLFGLPSHEKLSHDLQKYGIMVTMLPNENISDVLHTITTIGQTIDHTDQADRLVRQINGTLDSLKMTSNNKSTTAVLMIGREKGTLRNITAAGKDTYVNELWDLVGGKNSYSDLPTRYGTISLESLLLRDPNVIIEFDMKRERGVFHMEISTEWNFLENLSAVKNKNIFVVGGNHTMIPGPRLILLAEDFSKIIKDVTKK